jgi:hypothetical protein
LENTDEQLQDGSLSSHLSDTINCCVTDLQIEFCKSKACADCWAKEIELLQEEMKQVKRFFETHADKWMEHASVVSKTIHPSDLPMAKGMCAFAIEQASQFWALWSHCEHVWHYVAAYMRLGQGEIVPEEAQAHDDDDDIMTDCEWSSSCT